MLIALHVPATMTPKIRAAMPASDEPGWLVAERYGIGERAVWKLCRWDSVLDRRRTPQRFQTTLTPPQEAVVVFLNEAVLLSLHKTLSVVGKALKPDASHPGLDRCLRRYAFDNRRDLRLKMKPRAQAFKFYEPGYLHIDIKYRPQVAEEEWRRYPFVAIDRASRWVFVRIYPAKTAANARRLPRYLERIAPMQIIKVLTNNVKEFTDRLFGLRRRAATGNHDFDRFCVELGIGHRLTPAMRPQTNGVVESFSGRIENVRQGHHFGSGEDVVQTILRHVRLYKGQLQQSVLKGQTPIDALKDWQRQRPRMFRKRIYNHAGCDN